VGRGLADDLYGPASESGSRESAQKPFLAVLGSCKAAYILSGSFPDLGSSVFRSRRTAHDVSYPYALSEEAKN